MTTPSSRVRPILQAGLFLVLLFPSLDEIQYFFTDTWFITDWNDYLAPIVSAVIGLDKGTMMLIVGVVQMVVVVLIVVRPRLGGFAASAGFCLIIVNLLLHSAYDIAIRDFGLVTAGVALAVTATEFSRERTDRSTW